MMVRMMNGTIKNAQLRHLSQLQKHKDYILLPLMISEGRGAKTQ